jgi:hypothetical protein
MDWRPYSRPLDRNTKARILFVCEALERKTKAPGRRNGVLSAIGLVVLRCLIFKFQGRNGLLCPSYNAIQVATGLCRQSVAAALARLETAGVLAITRRLVRQRVTRISPITGLEEQIVTTTQTSSLYSISEPGAWAPHLARPPAGRAAFPSRRQLDLLQRMALTWGARLNLSEQSPRCRGNPLTGAQSIASIIADAIA